MADELLPILLRCEPCMSTGGVRVPCPFCQAGKPLISDHNHKCPSCKGSGHDPKVRAMLLRALDFDFASDAEFDAIARERGYVKLDVDVEAPLVDVELERLPLLAYIALIIEDFAAPGGTLESSQELAVVIWNAVLDALGGSDESA
jgi:hypothetical protein